MPIQAKDAALAAKKYFNEVVGELPGLTLEEVVKTDGGWRVTFSYFENNFSVKKLNKTLIIDQNGGEVLSMVNSL